MEIKVIDVPSKLNIEKTSEFRNEIYNALEAGLKNIVIDFANCDFIDSAGLGVLVSSYKKAMGQEGNFKLAEIDNLKVLKIFELTRLDKVFDIYPTLEEAINSFEWGGQNC